MPAGPRWHAALAHAVLGEVPPGLPEPGLVAVDRLLADLDTLVPGGLPAIRAELATRGVTRLPAHEPPPQLRAGLGAAQWFAALADVQQSLLLPPSRVTANRSLDPDERRLQADVPPHHGG